MYLSKLLVDPLDRGGAGPAYGVIADGYRLHQAIMSAFDPKIRGDRDVLYRVEPESRDRTVKILVQSEPVPDWDRTLARFFGQRTQVLTGEYNPEFRAGQRLRFRLRANPTRKVSVPVEGNSTPRKTRLGVLGKNKEGEDLQMKWLAGKLETAGARSDDCFAIPEGVVKTRQNDWTISLFSVRFEGVLEVVDPPVFLDAVRKGIGSAKGFGFGLLSVLPTK